MNFKIDTREKFTVITPLSDFFSDNITAEFLQIIPSFIEGKINLIINFKNVTTINEHIIKQIAALQHEFYKNNLSFVLCEMQNHIQSLISIMKLDEQLNITPSETEAWDIVQLEEIERELMNGDLQ